MTSSGPEAQELKGLVLPEHTPERLVQNESRSSETRRVLSDPDPLCWQLHLQSKAAAGPLEQLPVLRLQTGSPLPPLGCTGGRTLI